MTQRLVKHYREICQRRLSLWGCSIEVVLDLEQNQLVVPHGNEEIRLCFDPRHCVWSLLLGEERVEGNFDKLTNRCRRLLTSSPTEEEAR